MTRVDGRQLVPGYLAIDPLRIVPLAVLAFACGSGVESPETSSSDHAIVDGYVDEATRGVVGLAYDYGGASVAGHCSGALIAPNLVLTARHCVALTEGTAHDLVECGVTRFTHQGDGRRFVVSPRTVRPVIAEDPSLFRGEEVRSVPGADDICGFDVALIILEDGGIPLDLASPLVPRIDESPLANEVFSATGYGLTDPDGRSSGVRMRTDGNTVRCAGQSCREYLLDGIRSTEWLSTDAQVCPGDSGGPALDDEGRVIGVASRGATGCGSVIYGDVAAWGQFIIDTALDAAERGGYDPPAWTSGSSVAPVEESSETEQEVATDPIGQSCDDGCGEGQVCYSETGSPPGICVPRCAEVESVCPAEFVCSERLAACVPVGSPDDVTGASASGCALSAPLAPPGRSGPSLLAALTAVALAVRRLLSRAAA